MPSPFRHTYTDIHSTDFYRATYAMHVSVVLAVVILSVRLSVRLSVCHMRAL